MVTFEIHGQPFAKERPRFSRASGRAYTPSKTVSFEHKVGQIAMQHFPQPIEGAVKVTILASFLPAKSWSKKKTEAHLNRSHTQRPDLDNIEKAILDGLSRIAFADDSKVAWTETRKVWGPTPRTVVTIEAIT